MSDRQSALAGPGVMLLSAAIFGYFGFLAGFQWNAPGVDGQVVPFRILLGYTLQGSAIAFVLSAIMTYLKPWPGNLLYSIAGVVSALMLLVVFVMDYVDKQHASIAAPWLILVFAAWNGYGAWTGLQGVLASKPRHAADPRHLEE